MSAYAKVSRRTLLSAVAVTPLVLGACGGKKSGSALKEQKLTLPTHVAPRLPAGAIDSSVQGMPPIFVRPIPKYFQSVDKVPGKGGTVSTFQVLWGGPPRPMDQNPYWQQLNKRLGVTIKPTLTASQSYEDKLSTVIASGNIPDLTFVQDTTAVGQRAIVDGAFADLTEHLSGDGVKRWPNLANVGTNAWRASAKNGHLYGVPNENPYVTNFPGVRQDVLDELGVKQFPRTTDEFLDLAKEVAGRKVFKKKQLWVFNRLQGLEEALFESMFKAGTTWQLKDSKIINVLQTSVFGDVMEYERKLWKAGAFHSNALSEQRNEMFTQGQALISIDAFNGWFGDPIIGNVANSTPGAVVRFFIPPTQDGSEPTITRDDGYWGIVAISSQAATDKARVEELLSILNYYRAPYGSTENLFITGGIEGLNYKFGKKHEIIDNNNSAANSDRLALQWLGLFASPAYQIRPQLASNVPNFRDVVEHLTKLSKPNPVAGKMAPSAGKLSAKLDQISKDYRNGFVTGRRSLKELDSYRKEWLRAGGQKLCDEYTKAVQEG